MPSSEDDLFAQLEEVFAKVDEEGVEDLTKVPHPVLVDRVFDCTAQLAATLERLNPRTQRARDLHSMINACRLELRRRGVNGY